MKSLPPPNVPGDTGAACMDPSRANVVQGIKSGVSEAGRGLLIYSGFKRSGVKTR
jgi:hypothetical protein